MSDFDHDEVGEGRDEFHFPFGEGVLQVVASGPGEQASFFLVVGVLEAGQGPGLGDGVDVEWLACFLEDGDDFLATEAVADAQGGQPLDFGKRAQGDDIGSAFTDVFQDVDRLLEELVVGFVKNHNHAFRNGLDEPVECGLIDQSAAGVVGIGDEYFLGTRGDGGGHGLEVVLESGVRHLDGGGAEQGGHQFVNDKGVLGGDDLVAWSEEGVADQFDNFIAAIA